MSDKLFKNNFFGIISFSMIVSLKFDFFFFVIFEKFFLSII